MDDHIQPKSEDISSDVPSTKAQRTKYIEWRCANPGARVRGDMDLGPRVTVDVANTQRSSLERPEEWFVALDTYMADNPGVEIKESDKCWEWMDGQWIEGVAWFVYVYCVCDCLIYFCV